MSKENEARFDFADWLTTEGYGTPYRVKVDGYSSSNDHFTIPCLGKSIMAIRLTYFTSNAEVTQADFALWGERYWNESKGKHERFYYLFKHMISLEYLTESGWVEFVKFDTRVLQENILAVVKGQKQLTTLQRQTLRDFEEKTRTLLDHMITFHGLTLV